MEKKVTGNFDYDDGVVLKFQNSMPRHLQFYCKTKRDPTLSESESCNLRLFKSATKEMIEINSGRSTVTQTSDATVDPDAAQAETDVTPNTDVAEGDTETVGNNENKSDTGSTTETPSSADSAQDGTATDGG